jgi:Xaa-Pro aminopeptidase
MSAERLSRLRELIVRDGLDALIVSAPANLRYLTGYTGSNGLALVTAPSGDQPRFLTDFRYETQAEEEVDGSFKREIVNGELLDALARSLEAGVIGFEADSLTVRRSERLDELAGREVELRATGGLVEQLRAVKEPVEIARMARAAALIDEIFGWLVERGFAGRSERLVALELEHEMRLRGASSPSFGSIVASGAHGALPHAQPRDIAIKQGTLVTVDIGAILDGYCSDCTRTFAVGKPDPLAREIYELVLEAQMTGLRFAAPGRSGRDVDAIARAVIDTAGYGEYFGHGLGHGVGIEIHEAPRLSKRDSDAPLVAGNAITIEPGVYLPGQLGVRIEDLAVVTDDGVERLSHFPKELIVVE